MIFWRSGGKGSLTYLMNEWITRLFIEQPRLHRVCKKNITKIVICDTWHVTCDTWHATSDTRHVTCDNWHMTCDMWHVIGGTHSLKISALTTCGWWYFEDLEEKDHSLTEGINHEGVCRTAPTTPSLLNIWNQSALERKRFLLIHAHWLKWFNFL